MDKKSEFLKRIECTEKNKERNIFGYPFAAEEMLLEKELKELNEKQPDERV